MLLRAPAMYAVGWALMTFATTPVLAVVGAGLLGLGSATLPLILAIVSEHAPKHRSGLAAGLVNSLTLAGQLVAVGVGWLLVSGGQVSALFHDMAGMWLVLTILLFVFTREEKSKAVVKQEDIATMALWRQIGKRFQESWRESRMMLVEPETRLLKVLMMIAGVAPLLASTYIPVYLIALVRDPGMSAAYIAGSTAVGYLLGVLTTPAVGALGDRKRNVSQLLLGLLVILSAALVAIGQLSDPLLVSILAVVVAVAAQWLAGLQNALQLNLASTGSQTTFFMANQLPFYAGLPVGLLLGIVVIQWTGSIANALLLVGAMFAIGAVVWIKPMLSERRLSVAMAEIKGDLEES